MTTTSPSEEIPPSDSLPITAVTLFASGVAHIVREGQAKAGETTIDLTIRTTQVNDLLKSLTLLDPEGEARAVTYPSRDPISRALQSFAVDVTENIGRADLLKKLRGAEATVQTISDETMTGRIVGVETREEALDGRITSIETLILLTDEGVSATALDKIRILHLTNERLNREFREALTLLASRDDDARRQITLRFAGEKTRKVRAAYIVEAPVWKATYRLALADGERPYLQGWAIIENVTDEDWNNVEMGLISGRPISFVQDLYQPLYIHRPVVASDIIASPYPQTHEGDRNEPVMEESEEVNVMSERAGEERFIMGKSARMERGLNLAMSPMSAAIPLSDVSDMSDMRNSVSAQANGQSAGELFEYHITSPVTLPRQQAAMIPLLAGDWGGEKLSLYNADTDARFPLNAVRLKNESALHLKGGPVTVFDAGAYAGDARMTDIPPGDERLLTYAVDLTIEGERQETISTGSATFTIKQGVLIQKRSQRLKTIYTLKSKAKTKRVVLVEHPFQALWTLTEPVTPTERTADLYRFAITLEPGERKTLTVAVERPIEETMGLFDSYLNGLIAYVNNGTLPEKLRNTLRGVTERRQLLDRNEALSRSVEEERETIHREQERIRGNMAALDRNSALYRRYVGELDKQETRLAELTNQSERLRNERQVQLQDLQKYIDALEIN